MITEGEEIRNWGIVSWTMNVVWLAAERSGRDGVGGVIVIWM